MKLGFLTSCMPERSLEDIAAWAGAHGIILSRKYSEMKLDNLRAAGRAVRDLKLA